MRKLAQQRITSRASRTRLSQQKSCKVFLEVFAPRQPLMLTLEWLGEFGDILFFLADQAWTFLFLLHVPLQSRKCSLFLFTTSARHYIETLLCPTLYPPKSRQSVVCFNACEEERNPDIWTPRSGFEHWHKLCGTLRRS